MSNYIVGNNAIIRATFQKWNETSNAYEDANPDAVTVTVRSPSGISTPYPMDTTGTLGEFTATVPIDAAGVWRYTVVGGGNFDAVSSGSYLARNPSPIPA